VSQHLAWYVARSTGLVAWVLLTLSVLLGVLASTRLLGRNPRPIWLVDLHRGISGLATIFVGLHLAGLVGDDYLHVGWREVLVPFALRWRPGPVAWGVTSLYLLAAVELTSLARSHLPTRLWRRIHVLSFPLWITATVHVLTAGTERTNPAVQWVALASIAGVVFLTMIRVLSPKPARTRPVMPAR
jgi:predicted ferric reductase